MFRNCFCFWLFGILCGFILQVGQDLAIELDEIMDIPCAASCTRGSHAIRYGTLSIRDESIQKKSPGSDNSASSKKGRERGTVSGPRMSPQLKDVLNAEISLDFCKDP